MQRIPGHGLDLRPLKECGILLDAQRADRILLQRFSRRQIGPVFFEITERRARTALSKAPSKLLFESQETDHAKCGTIGVAQSRSTSIDSNQNHEREHPTPAPA